MENLLGSDQVLRFEGIFRCGALDDFDLVFLGWVIDLDFQHETIELSLRQCVGAFLFDWVLSGQYEKRIWQFVGFTTNGELPFLHGFEQGTLCLGRCAVDLVSQDDIPKNWAFDKPEDPLPCRMVLLQNVGAGDIGRHQVWRELDPSEGQI